MANCSGSGGSATASFFGVAQFAVRAGLALQLALCRQHHLARLVALGPLHGDRAVAEGGIVEDAADGFAVPLRLLELPEQAGDLLDMRVRQFLALAAQALAHLLPEAARVDELHLALAVRGLAVAHDPDIGRDAGVVEHVRGQPDDGLQEVVLDDVAADFALAAARAAREERRAVEHDAEAAAALVRWSASC